MTDALSFDTDLAPIRDLHMSEDLLRRIFPKRAKLRQRQPDWVFADWNSDVHWPDAQVRALRETWARHDRRQQIFAPGFCVFQALTTDGQSVSGAAETAKGAVSRLLGETAEAAYLSEGPVVAFAAETDGLAAGPDRAATAHRALMEAVERKRIRQWWHSEVSACRVDAAWVAAVGLDGWLREMREGAEAVRQCRLWRLPSVAGETVMIAASFGAPDEVPVVGYGTAVDPVAAARKALRETLLMEMRVVDQRAYESGAVASDEVMARRLAETRRVGERAAGLLPHDGPRDYPAPVPDVDVDALECWLGGVHYHFHADLPVVHCKVKGQEIMTSDGFPFYRDAGDAPGATRAPVGCCPVSKAQFQKKSVISAPTDGAGSPVPSRPAIAHLAGSADWRVLCQREVAQIPSGYTYLAQLVGHDMGHSTPLDQVVYSAKSQQGATNNLQTPMPQAVAELQQTQGASPVRYNLIENPLTLETVYGTGPDLMNHVFDQATGKFHLERGSRIAKTATAGGMAVRALYDPRNRDTLMLHELTVAWMQFHNRTMDRLNAAGVAWEDAYNIARVHSVLVWHDIIREDLLPRFVLPGVMNAPLDALHQVDEVTLLHAIFRAFHCLPLDAYRLRRGNIRGRALKDLMSTGFAPSLAEREWDISWDFFFSSDTFQHGKALPTTGISPSFAQTFNVNGSHISLLDFNTAAETHPLCIADPWFADLRANWDVSDVSAPMTAAELCAAFETRFGTDRAIDPAVLANAPLYEVLMVEGLLQGARGGFGPLGSCLLRGSQEAAMARVKLHPENKAQRDALLGQLHAPKTMLDLINSK